MGEVSRLLADYGPAFGQALLLTWKLTFLSFVPGFLLGMIQASIRRIKLLQATQTNSIDDPRFYALLPGAVVGLCFAITVRVTAEGGIVVIHQFTLQKLLTELNAQLRVP